MGQTHNTVRKNRVYLQITKKGEEERIRNLVYKDITRKSAVQERRGRQQDSHDGREESVKKFSPSIHAEVTVFPLFPH